MMVLALVSFGLWRFAEWDYEVAYRVNLRVAEGLAAAHPSDADRQRDLAISHRMVGDVLKDQGLLSVTGGLDRRLEDALANYRASLTIFERLAAADPSDAGLQHDLSFLHMNLGDIAGKRGDRDGQRKEYGQARDILLRLAALDPSNATGRDALAWVEQQLKQIDGRKWGLLSLLANILFYLSIVIFLTAVALPSCLRMLSRLSGYYKERPLVEGAKRRR